MINVLLIESQLHITTKSKEEFKKSQLLFTLDSSEELLSILYNQLRCYVDLRLGDGWYDFELYKEELLNYFQKSLYNNSSFTDNLVFIYYQDIVKLIEKFNNYLRLLISLEYIDSNVINDFDIANSGIIYKCDIINYLEHVYSPSIVSDIIDFSCLDNKASNFLYNLTSIRNLKSREDYFRSNIEDLKNKELVIKYLPESLKLSYKFMNMLNKDSIKIEYNNTNKLTIEKKLNLRDFIIEEFKLGETYTGEYIKNNLNAIYTKFKLNKKAKINDLYEYFWITKVNLNNESSYRIDRRK